MKTNIRTWVVENNNSQQIDWRTTQLVLEGHYSSIIAIWPSLSKAGAFKWETEGVSQSRPLLTDSKWAKIGQMVQIKDATWVKKKCQKILILLNYFPIFSLPLALDSHPKSLLLLTSLKLMSVGVSSSSAMNFAKLNLQLIFLAISWGNFKAKQARKWDILFHAYFWFNFLNFWVNFEFLYEWRWILKCIESIWPNFVKTFWEFLINVIVTLSKRIIKKFK